MTSRAAISPGLAKAVLTIRLNDALCDLARPITEDAAIKTGTLKDRKPEVLEPIRHDATHALAEAAKELHPDVQAAVGPATEDGFHYGFARDEPFTPSDLEAMEERMREIVARNEPITREVWNRDEAVQYFQSIGEEYKAEIIRDFPADEEITIYRQGEFVDLCRGPHLPSTGKLGTAFKLPRLVGADADADAGLCWHEVKAAAAGRYRSDRLKSRKQDDPLNRTSLESNWRQWIPMAPVVLAWAANT